jgi:hypothetical protein
VDLAFSTIDFSSAAPGSPVSGSFSGPWTPPASGIYHFEILRREVGSSSSVVASTFSIEVVDIQAGQLTYAEMRTPSAGSSVNVTQTVTLSANIGPSILREYITVDYYVNGYKVTDEPVTFASGGAFFSYVWEAPYIGDVTVHARAQLASGAFIESNVINVTLVGVGSQPSVSISAPPGDDWVAGSEAQFTVQASDSGALVEVVQFVVNGVVVESISSAWQNSPWTFDFKFPSSGYYDIWAIAQFSNGNKAISNLLQYDLEMGRQPFVSLISPVPGMQVLPGSSMPILASAWDPNTLIRELKYFVNDTLIGTSQRTETGAFDPDPLAFPTASPLPVFTACMCRLRMKQA